VAMLGLLVGKTLCLALAPFTFEIGYFLIHTAGLEGLVRTLLSMPLLAFSGLDHYCLVGGLPVALVVGILLALFLSRGVQALRIGLVEAVTRSERMQKLSKNFLIRFFLWLVFGKQKATLTEGAQKKSPLFRTGGLILIILCVLLSAALETFVLDLVFKTGLEKGLGVAFGAETNVSKAHLSLIGGEMTIEDLQVTDAKKNTNNLFSVEHLSAKVSLSDLLAGRFRMALLEGSNIQFGTLRTTPGTVYPKTEIALAPEAQKAGEGTDKGKEAAKAAEAGSDLTQYFGKAEEAKKYLSQIQEYLEKRKAEKKAQEADDKAAAELAKQNAKAALEAEAKAKGYLALSAKNLLTASPTWIIDKVVLDKVALKPDALQRVEASDLSSHPELTGKPTAIQIAKSGETAPWCEARLHSEKPGTPNDIKIDIKGVDVAAAGLSDRVPLHIQEAKAALSAEGTFKEDALNLPFKIELSNLKAQSADGQGFLGLSPEVANEVFQELNTLTIEGTLAGTPGAPTVKLDEKKMLETLKATLQKAGKDILLKKVGEQADKLQGEATKRLEDATKKIEDEVKSKLPPGAGDALDKLKDKLPDAKSRIPNMKSLLR